MILKSQKDSSFQISLNNEHLKYMSQLLSQDKFTSYFLQRSVFLKNIENNIQKSKKRILKQNGSHTETYLKS